MKNHTTARILTYLSVAGFLFSGYIAGTKLLTETCALNEPCPYIFGYPACYIGFVLFTITLIGALLYQRTRRYTNCGISTVRWATFAGVLFAGYFSYTELPLQFPNGIGTYALGLPTCVLGFIFFVLIFLLSLTANRRRRPGAL